MGFKCFGKIDNHVIYEGQLASKYPSARRGAVSVAESYRFARNWFTMRDSGEYNEFGFTLTDDGCDEVFDRLVKYFWDARHCPWFPETDGNGIRVINNGSFAISEPLFKAARQERCCQDKNALISVLSGNGLPEEKKAETPTVPVSKITVVDHIRGEHRIANGSISDRGRCLREAHPDAALWFAIDDKYGFMEIPTDGEPLDHIVELMWERKDWPDRDFESLDGEGFRRVGKLSKQSLVWLSKALFERLRTPECKTDKEQLRAVVHGKSFIGGGAPSTAAGTATSAFVADDRGNPVPSTKGLIGDGSPGAFVVGASNTILGVTSAIIVGGNSSAITTTDASAFMVAGTKVESAFGAEGDKTMATLENTRDKCTTFTQGKLSGLPNGTAAVFPPWAKIPGWPSGVVPFVDAQQKCLPITFLKTPFGTVLIMETALSKETTLSTILGDCLGPVRSRDSLKESAVLSYDCTGKWAVEASSETWTEMEAWVSDNGVKNLAAYMMSGTKAVQRTEGETMAQTVEQVEGPQQEKTVKARAKRAAKKAGKDALEDAKEALFRGTVRNTVKEVHGTAITIAKGVTDNDTAMMVVALMETERGKAALAAGFGAILGFMIDMLEGEHPALERVARELKVENGSVLMDPIIGAVLAPLAQLFARVCLMAGDKSAAEQVHKLTAPLQLVAAGGTLVGDEVRVAEKVK